MYISALLDYTNANAKAIQAVVKAADDKTVADVEARAESEQLRNWLDGRDQSRGKIDVLGYRSNVAEYRPGTSILGTRPGTASGPPEVATGVDDSTKPVGTRDAVVPRAYLIPAEMGDVVAKLRAHNIRVTALEQPIRVEGEQFAIKSMRKVRSAGYDMTTLEGAFLPVETRDVTDWNVLSGYGAADGQRRVLLPRAASPRRIRRMGASSTIG